MIIGECNVKIFHKRKARPDAQRKDCLHTDFSSTDSRVPIHFLMLNLKVTYNANENTFE